METDETKFCRVLKKRERRIKYKRKHASTFSEMKKSRREFLASRLSVSVTLKMWFMQMTDISTTQRVLGCGHLLLKVLDLLKI